MRPDLTCHCTVCDRAFEYGDAVSPMFDDGIWDRLIAYYHLAEHEAEAFAYQKQALSDGDWPYCSDRKAHTYICADCAEKALGRRIRMSDLNGSDFNEEFTKAYFSDSRQNSSV